MFLINIHANECIHDIRDIRDICRMEDFVTAGSYSSSFLITQNMRTSDDEEQLSNVRFYVRTRDWNILEKTSLWKTKNTYNLDTFRATCILCMTV